MLFLEMLKPKKHTHKKTTHYCVVLSFLLLLTQNATKHSLAVAILGTAGVSREDLGTSTGTSGAVIGRYERNEITPSVEIANKIAQALDVSLDYLVGNNSVIVKDKKILERVEAIANMPDNEQQQIFNVIDALLRDYNAKKAYA
jgi:transcriptional regulator with XRE-family HTH domain